MTMLFYNLPENQRRVLHFIIRNIEDKGESPTHAEIAAAFDMSEQHVHNVLNALEKKGRIKRDKHQHRSITVIE